VYRREVIAIITRIHVVQKVNQLLTSAISTGVSDIDFEPFEDVMLLFYDNSKYILEEE
jgi:type II secretory ATPase GspE/PulE/Tfp pilus assembly ATPase PilB-like protein